MLELNQLIHGNCMDYMKQFPDKYFELAIVDPPYGLERLKRSDSKNNRLENNIHKHPDGLTSKWNQKPSPEYFEELFRVSQNQIIWGGNNFTLPQTEYFIVWDKLQTVDNFASAEYAWTNIKVPAKVFRYSIAQKEIFVRKKQGGKIHPTQKPERLYEWLVANYAKEGDKILDTHVGSASSLVAFHNCGFDYIGFEIDEHYYKLASERLEAVKSQMSLF